MAAAGDPSITLQDEVTCSICLDYFRDPVMIIDCGHSFCRACISQCPEGPGRDLSSCPQCRIAFPRGNLRPNRHLANMAEAIQRLRLQCLSLAEGEPKKEAPKLCGKHYEALRLFCQEDRAFICLVCRESRAHKAHATLPIDEAAQDAKDQLQSCLTTLKKERDEILKRIEGCSEREMKNRVGSIRDQVAGNWELLLACAEIMESIDKIASEFSERSSHLAKLIKEVEEKCLKSAFELLQDMDPLLSRCNIEISGKPKADLNKKVELLNEKLQLVQTKLRQLSGVPQQLNQHRYTSDFHYPVCDADYVDANTVKSKWKRGKWKRENVVFDPETAHPRYIVSSDGKSVWWGKVRQDYPYSSIRFEYARCLLGMWGFSSGKHYWTVDVEGVNHWAVGVARESVERDREINFEPDEGIWAVGFSRNDQFKALTSPPTYLDPEEGPTQIQVSLNYEAGTVAFYDAEDKTRLFIFESIDFEGEEVFPFFRIVDPSVCLQLCY
ncbi:E3 ubiquitin-protein ligase TRIM39-like isoform X2 [Zootoca vivipara]|uniref:E3 ubiquitin-protein ligase TRIM39-like isoform X2 n=1 Tax=Zootoca vivipara TaxID=8524 RepID=UPI00293BE9AE|nr:E3 ubiquitin-protein ligase TRIM39-like isoform X2 [Zootoca vivipara]